MIYFTSDNHFCHEAIIRFCNRPWKTVEEMNEGMITLWNATVREGDTVYVVGDFCFSNSKQREEILNRLNGFKILIQGNHDKGKTCPKGFQAMLYEATMVIAGEEVTLKHYPLRYTGLKALLHKWTGKRTPRYLDRMPPNKGQWHIHGHTHNPEKFNGKQIHVGVDAWDYRPVSIKQIEKYIHQYKSLGGDMK